MSSPYTICDYIGPSGYCNKRCYGGRCAVHRNRPTKKFCINIVPTQCSRGTSSISGYCRQCGNLQIIGCRRISRQKLKDEKAAQQALEKHAAELIKSKEIILPNI
jgi:hypothetical protein